jgi:hypothetical protein
MNNIKILFEKYNFDYIYINPKALEYLDWDFIPDELLVDVKHEPGYIGTLSINNSKIKVYYDKKITPGDVTFKYKNIRKERNIKLENLFKS